MEASAYMPYCPPDSLFFDRPDFGGGAFEQTHLDPPSGWRRAQDSDWVNLVPPGDVPTQGWKIHVSSTPDDAARALDVCWDFCTERGLMFKFLRGTQVLFLRSSKYGDRSASGKFVTIYPEEGRLQEVLEELDPLLRGLSGPTILSDLRWKDGPLYVRYGGFVPRRTRLESGELVLAIEDPQGRLVPDERRPGFHLPEWLEPPDFINEAIARRNQGRLTDFPYRPTKALHFSNGGGVYLAEDAGGRTVVLKEARPLAALDTDGSDAVARLEREHWAMQRLAALPEIPELYDYRKGHEHWFLVREHIQGKPLNQVLLERNPLLRGGATAAELESFTEWAMAVWARVEDVVARMHAEGVAFRDLHPGNVLVDDATGDLHVIDFESAREVSEDLSQSMGAPAYMAPPEFRGPDVDRHALGIMGIDLFVPMAHLLPWGDGRRRDLTAMVSERFPVDRTSYEARLGDFLTPSASASAGTDADSDADVGTEAPSPAVRRPRTSDVAPGDWEAADPLEMHEGLRARLARGILHHATPEREDRLYPGDPAQLRSPTGGIGFLHGASGVQWALATNGQDVPRDHREWLLDAVQRHDWDSYGLGEGLCGPALALLASGDRDRALELLERAWDLAEEDTTLRLVDGLAGLGLTALHAGDDQMTARAERLASRMLDWRADSAGLARGRGLLDGKAGASLFLLRLHQRTGDETLLRSALDAVRAELTGCGWSPGDDSVPEMIARAPFLAAGGGLAVVVSALAEHSRAPDLLLLHRQFADAFDVPLAAESGLLHGRAGLMCVLALTGGSRSAVQGHARDLRLHTVELDEELVTVGRFGLRASCDLATGTAGLLVGIGALHGQQGGLPFTGAPTASAPAAGTLVMGRG